MDRFDVLMIGSGSGMIVAANAVANGLRTALVNPGPLGGTCLNRGCVPSKMLIYPADVVATIQEAEKLSINSRISSIDFKNMMKRMHQLVTEDAEQQVRAMKANSLIKWFKNMGSFVEDYTLRVENALISAEKIFIVSGARPDVPQIKGIDDLDFLTSDTVLQLEKLPKSMVIIGGGYIAAEYGHFFASMRVKVTIIQRSPRLLPDEESGISDLLKLEIAKSMEIFTNHEAVKVMEKNGDKIVVARNRDDGSFIEFSAETLLVATGRIPNSDSLKPDRTGVELDKRGFVKVNEYLETRKKNIWAFGDAIGEAMFKHVANYEAQIVWHNASHEHKIKMDYSAASHAVFSHPQVASVGIKEAEAKQHGYKILVGTAFYKDTAMGAQWVCQTDL